MVEIKLLDDVDLEKQLIETAGGKIMFGHLY